MLLKRKIYNIVVKYIAFSDSGRIIAARYGSVFLYYKKTTEEICMQEQRNL